PVCGMRVDPSAAAATASHGGTLYHFCSTGCVKRFEADPQKFVAGRVEPMPRVAGLYTCPMHPEVVQQGPGSCPICGVAREPLSAAEAPDDGELRDLGRRLWVSAACTIPVALLGMSEMWGGHASPWVQLVLSTPVVVWGGAPFFVRGWQSIV